MVVAEQESTDPGSDPFSFLVHSEFLSGVDEAELRSIDPPPDWVTLQKGDTLIHQGAPGEAFYFLVHGRMRAFVTDNDGVRRMVGEIVPGDEVGEMSLLTDQPTTAEVRARHDCLLIRFPKETYLHMVETYPQAGLHVARTAIRRLQAGMGMKKHSLPWPVITVLPIAPGLDLTDFVEGLATALKPFGSVDRIGHESVPDTLAPSLRGTQRLGPAVDNDLTAHLTDREQSHDVTLYVGDPHRRPPGRLGTACQPCRLGAGNNLD